MNNILVSSGLADVCIKEAYEKLSDEEAAKIDILAEQLESRYKMRWNSTHHKIKANFGHGQALELLAKIGIHLNECNKKGAINEE
jgi:2-hydroxy-3-keto-5-methylthiopentenyl-1-phosphate phosphatase